MSLSTIKINANGNKVLLFIATALILMDVNTVLAFHGLEFKDDGKFYTIKSVSTLTEAEKRSKKFTTSIFDCNLHEDLLRFYSAELLQDNYFHAVLEATKSVVTKFVQ